MDTTKRPQQDCCENFYFHMFREYRSYMRIASLMAFTGDNPAPRSRRTIGGGVKMLRCHPGTGHNRRLTIGTGTMTRLDKKSSLKRVKRMAARR